jgi:hypothetical protein
MILQLEYQQLSFKDYAEKSKEYFTKLSSYLVGNNSAPTLDINFDLSTELNALQNASSAEQLIQLSNAFYDQVAVKRSLAEIYKKPKDYLKEYKNVINGSIQNLTNLDLNVDEQIISVNKNKTKSQSIRNISSRLQLKLSLIKDNTNA